MLLLGLLTFLVKAIQYLRYLILKVSIIQYHKKYLTMQYTLSVERVQPQITVYQLLRNQEKLYYSTIINFS